MRERGAGRGLSTSYLEPDHEASDDEGAISLSAIKSKYKKGGNKSKSSLAMLILILNLAKLNYYYTFFSCESVSY